MIVKGKPVTQDGRWRFEIDGINKIYNLSTRHDHVILGLQSKNVAGVKVSAVTSPPADPQTVPILDVTAIIP